jgi:tetratricopeptide (TPR) repeat protein
MNGARVAAALLLGGALALAAAGSWPAAAREGAPAADRSVADLVRDADAAFAREDYAGARALYEEAVRRGAEAVHPLRRLALLMSWDGDLDASIACYRRALALAPDDLDLSLELAKVLSWDNQLAESIRILEGQRVRHPDDPRVLLALAQVLAWKGRYDAADAIYRDMEERRLEAIQAHVGRARALAWKGDLDRAIEFYRDVLKADPGNVDARFGIVQVHHWQGLDRSASAQAENLVVDHPENREAVKLREEIRQALRPRGDLDAYRLSDSDSNRVDAGTAAYTFMAEPQTSVRIAYSDYDAEFRCKTLVRCSGDPQAIAQDAGVGAPVDTVPGTRAQALVAGVTSRVIAPINFHARIALVREEDFAGGARVFGAGGGYLRWQVGPRFAVGSNGGREALLDTAELASRGLRVDTAEVRLEYRFRTPWLLSGSAGYGSYSDGNARRTAGVSLEWRLRSRHPSVAGTFEARYRSFNDDTDHGYFDPLRYDSELLTVAVWDQYARSRIFWRVEGTLGRQDFDGRGGSAPGAGQDDTVQAFNGSLGVGLGSRASLEAFYSRSDYALQVATGFTSSRTGFALRMRF